MVRPDILSLPHLFFYMRCLNNHHVNWRYESNDQNGEVVIDWPDFNNLHLTFDYKDQQGVQQKESRPMIYVRAINRKVLGSQHRLSLISWEFLYQK